MAESFPLKIIFDAINRTGPAFKDVNKGLSDLKNVAAVAGAAIGAALAGIGVAALKNAADFETLEVKFKGLLGSAEKGKALAKTLADFAAATPFSLKGLSENAVQLLAFGSSVDELIPQLTLLGDLSAGVGVDVAELVTPFGRIKNANKATLIELDKFEDRGIPVIKRIAEMTGKSYGDIRKAVSDGAVDFKLFNAAIGSIRTNSFNNAMAELSKTLGGKWANIIDSLDLALAALGRVLADVFDVKDIADSFILAMGDLKKALDNIDPETLENLKATLKVIYELALILAQGVAFAAKDIYGFVKPIWDLLSLIVKVIWEIYAAWLSVTSRVKVNDLSSATQAWALILKSVNQLLEDMLGPIGKVIDFITQRHSFVVDAKFNGFDKQLPDMIKAVQNSSIALVPKLQKITPPEILSGTQSFTNSPLSKPSAPAQQANLAITVDVKNGTSETKVKSSQGFKIDKNNIKTGRIAQSS
jgi:hypothetical protein